MAELEGKIYDGSLATRLAEAERRLSGLSAACEKNIYGGNQTI